MNRTGARAEPRRPPSSLSGVGRRRIRTLRNERSDPGPLRYTTLGFHLFIATSLAPDEMAPSGGSGTPEVLGSGSVRLIGAPDHGPRRSVLPDDDEADRLVEAT